MVFTTRTFIFFQILFLFFLPDPFSRVGGGGRQLWGRRHRVTQGQPPKPAQNNTLIVATRSCVVA